MSRWLALRCNGRAATAEDLAAPALVNDGHFTTLQVRGAAAQGFGLHLERLRAASRLLFGCDEAPERIRAEVLAALAQAGTGDATVRVTVHRGTAGPGAPSDLLVSVAPPALPAAAPLRLQGRRFVRTLPEVKHAGTFPLFHHRRLARAAGFDDALFVDDRDRVCEGSVWNLALWDGERVIWPRGPALRGTRERLLQAAFDAMGATQAARPVALAELPELAGIACNARGVQPLAAIDGRPMRDPAPLLALAAEAGARIPWEPVAGARAAPTAAVEGPL